MQYHLKPILLEHAVATFLSPLIGESVFVPSLRIQSHVIGDGGGLGARLPGMADSALCSIDCANFE